MANKNILLIEPSYNNKYVPLGLMKLAAYHGPRGKRDNVTFIKGEDRSVLSTAWDRIYVTTLFSFEYRRIGQAIDFAMLAASGQSDRVFVGGIAASLMADRFKSEPRWGGVRFIKGLLTEAPATALQLDEFAEELYSDDTDGTPIEDLVPDYGIIGQVSYKYAVQDAYFLYSTRGCTRTCRFCGVPPLEGALRDTGSLTSMVRAIDRLYGPRRDLLLMDNNVTASAKFKEIIAEIRDLGFTPGATLDRPGSRVPLRRRVDFNQGVDARILCKDPMYLRELSTIALRPLRIAFDHAGLRKPYEQAVRYAAAAGLTELSNYMLYNFHDGPSDLFSRMRLNVSLNEALGVRIWSFPMRYQPTDRPDRQHVGPGWTRYQLRSMQVILQATHGVVTGDPAFFKYAFGDAEADFSDMLATPHDFIFNRGYYEREDPEGRLGEFRSELGKLGAADRAELLCLLSSCDPSAFRHLPGKSSSKQVGRILRFYEPVPKREQARIWDAKRAARQQAYLSMNVPEDERVEDAGLYDDPIGTAPAKAA